MSSLFETKKWALFVYLLIQCRRRNPDSRDIGRSSWRRALEHWLWDAVKLGYHNVVNIILIYFSAWIDYGASDRAVILAIRFGDYDMVSTVCTLCCENLYFGPKVRTALQERDDPAIFAEVCQFTVALRPLPGEIRAGVSMLYKAVKRRDVRMVRLLLALGATPTTRGFKIVGRLQTQDELEIAYDLLTSITPGFQIWPTNEYLQTWLPRLAKMGNLKLLKVLSKFSLDLKCWYEAVKGSALAGQVAVLRYLTEEMWDGELKYHYVTGGMVAMEEQLVAAVRGEISINSVERLLMLGASLNTLKEEDIMKAIERKDSACLRLFIQCWNAVYRSLARLAHSALESNWFAKYPFARYPFGLF
ncbi:hypothetical protein HDU76_006346 [Blyttiomyces sp. JEL0837]|nr:hypothetical protein HDU76_006346 [Blyttiomyces sp. JEL0837]